MKVRLGLPKNPYNWKKGAIVLPNNLDNVCPVLHNNIYFSIIYVVQVNVAIITLNNEVLVFYRCIKIIVSLFNKWQITLEFLNTILGVIILIHLAVLILKGLELKITITYSGIYI